MGKSVSPRALIRTDEIVRALSIAPSGGHLVWGGDAGVVHRLDPSGSESSSFEVSEAVAHIHTWNDGAVAVGTFAGDLHGHAPNGERIWSVPLGGGSEAMKVSENGSIIAVIDGVHDVHLISSDGSLLGTHRTGEATQISLAADGGNCAVALDSGTLSILDGRGVEKRRVEPRCEEGIRISAVCHRSDGTIVVASEAIGLASDGEPQIAIECFEADGRRLHIVEIDAVATALCPTDMGVFAGLDDGTVLSLSIDGSPSITWASVDYSVSDLLAGPDYLLVASWFHLRRYDAAGEEAWRVEHVGLIDSIHSDSSGDHLALAGQDPNDWTRINRIDLYDVDAEPFKLTEDDDPAMLDESLYAESSEPELDDDLIDYQYEEEDPSDLKVEDLLTEKEAAAWKGLAMGGNLDEDEARGIMGLLQSESKSDSEEGDEEDAFDVLAGLHDEEAVRMAPPKAHAGNDQTIDAGDDGTATTTLDGSESTSSSSSIASHLWRDANGAPIGDSIQIKVRLGPGSHRFTLTVSDANGTTATDSVHVVVTGEIESQEESLLD